MAKKSTEQVYRKLVIKNGKKTYKDMTEKEIEELQKLAAEAEQAGD